MSEFDQSTLMAYVDGELDEQTAAAVERRLAHDEAARAYVGQLRELNALAKSAFNAPLHEATPLALREAVTNAGRASPEASPEASNANVTTLIASAPPPPPSSISWRQALPLAAGVVGLVLGALGSGQYIDYRTNIAVHNATQTMMHDQAAMTQVLNQALEQNVSGTTARWQNPDTGRAAEITPVRTYQDANQSYCREYQKRVSDNGTTQTTFGLACRANNGTWNTRYVIHDGLPGENL